MDAWLLPPGISKPFANKVSLTSAKDKAKQKASICSTMACTSTRSSLGIVNQLETLDPGTM